MMNSEELESLRLCRSNLIAYLRDEVRMEAGVIRDYTEALNFLDAVIHRNVQRGENN